MYIKGQKYLIIFITSLEVWGSSAHCRRYKLFIKFITKSSTLILLELARNGRSTKIKMKMGSVDFSVFIG